MRKKVYCAVIILVLLVAFLVGCSSSKDKEKNSDNISYQVSSYYVGENEDFAISIESGKRETPFIADGICSEVASFTTLKLLPLKISEIKSLSYEILGEANSLIGEISVDNKGEMSADINLLFSPTHIKVTSDKTVLEIQLDNVLKDAILIENIVSIAKVEFKDRIDLALKSGKLNRELYIKVITGDRDNYYYYVSYIGKGVDYWAMLIEPKTGVVLSKR